MGLKETITEIEKDIGFFSKKYKTIEGGHTYTIPFEQKPAQQLITALGGSKDQHALLSTTPSVIKTSDNVDVTIKGFTPKTASKELTISGKRLDRLLSSDKVYVNTDLFPSGLYQLAIKKPLVSNKIDTLPPEAQGIHWENLAVGVCHVQEIDLLVSTITSSHKKAHTTIREGTIEEHDPALLLLSNPSLNLRSGVGKHLDKNTQNRFIEGMFRNLFDATQKEGRQYIAMPAAGLGIHGGTPEMYFSALMKVAKEFPNLNIIYHPGDHEKTFDKKLKKAKRDNVVRATKNIIFIADKLTQLGNSCALHIPADSKVIYGLTDIGGHWKSIDKEPHHSTLVGDLLFGDKKNETSQTYIGTVSTAPLNSFGLNPKSYMTIIERNLDPTLNEQHVNSTILQAKDQETSHLPLTATIEKPQIEANQEQTPSPEEKLPNSSAVNNKNTDTTTLHADEIKQPEQLSHFEQTPVIVVNDKKEEEHPPIPMHTTPQPEITDQLSLSTPKSQVKGVTLICSPGKPGLFSLPSQPVQIVPKLEPTTSSLNKKQLQEINRAIDHLTGEIQSCWPYPNKDLKQIKVEALHTLITNAHTMSIHEAIAAVKEKYPRATEGTLSTRTADLFDKLEKSGKTDQLTM